MSSKKTDKKQGTKKPIKNKNKPDTINNKNATGNIAITILSDEYEENKEIIKDLIKMLEDFDQENKGVTNKREELVFKIKSLCDRQKFIEKEIKLLQASDNKDLTDKKENLESNDINDNS